MKINTSYNGDALEILRTFPKCSIDLCLTSPPYANARLRTYGGIHPDQYIKWLKPIAKEIYRVLTNDGSFILNIGDNTVNGETHLYTFEIPIMLKKEIGFKFIDPLIWHKKTTPPGAFKNRFKSAWEFCFHFSKQINIKFNPKAVAQPVSDVSVARYKRHKDFHVMKSQSGSGFNNASKNGSRRERKNNSDIAGTNAERLNMLEIALPTNVLYLSPETMNVNHPAPFPSGLPEFFIKAFTNKGDLILDPFSGSGTTGMVAKKLCRNYVLIDIKEEYVDSGNRRIEKECGILL